MNVTKISQKMKNKSLLSIEKMAMRNENEKMAILKSQESILI